MNAKELEDLYLKSLDTDLTPVEKMRLDEGLDTDPERTRIVSAYGSLRAALQREKEASFGPYFSQRVINRLQKLKKEWDVQIAVFFKRYQLAALGILIALLAINVLLADNLSLSAILGVEETVADEIVTFDFYENLTTE